MSLTTIILPYYKKSQFIDQTIQSILNQTNQKFEIIIVDDELSDQSSKIMNKLSYHVVAEKIQALGFKFEGDLAIGIRETLQQLEGISGKLPINIIVK